MIRFRRFEFLGLSSTPQSISDHLGFPSSLLDSISDGLKSLICSRYPHLYLAIDVQQLAPVQIPGSYFCSLRIVLRQENPFTPLDS